MDRVMIHRVNARHNNGHLLFIRAIEKETGLSRNAIRNNLRMSEGGVLVTKGTPSER